MIGLFMLRDLLGRTFDFPTPPRRVVSLVPSLTESLFDLGAGDTVAGVTDYCIFPEVIDAARLGGTKNPNVGRIVSMNLARVIGERLQLFQAMWLREMQRTVDNAHA